MGVRERLVCRSCYKRAGLEGEETTLGILVPMRCTICGCEVPPSELRQPKHHYEQIRERLSAMPRDQEEKP